MRPSRHPKNNEADVNPALAWLHEDDRMRAMKGGLRFLVAIGLMLCAQVAYAAPVSDTFDHYNDQGWQTLWNSIGSYRVGNFEASTTGNCYRDSCVYANSQSFGNTFSTYMYLKAVDSDSSGAYTIWMRSHTGIYRAYPSFGICVTNPAGCGENGRYIYWWNNVVPADDTWHQVYFGWRQGATGVEGCFMQDDANPAHCTWSDTGLALGTTFDGIVLSGGGGRPDFGDNLWFDELAPAATTSAAVCATDCNDNVMFLPGIEASRLYRSGTGGEQKLWEPGSDADAAELAMNANGTSARSDIYTRDILDTAYVLNFGNVYKSFIADMNGLVSSGKINAWTPVAYDWRYSLDQILASGKVIGADGSISYSVATSSPYIIQELKHLAATSRSGKVTLIAHSNGGLVAKALMVALGPDASHYVDRIILVASPQIGTPVALGALLHGTQQGLPIERFPRALSPATARSIGDTMPGLYSLLPSASYFTYVDDPVATFDAATMPDWVSAYGDVVHSTARQHAFLADTSHFRLAPIAADLKDPTILSDAMLIQAENLHQSLDAWTPPSGIKIIQIAGWGIPTTIKGIDYKRVTATTSLGIFTGIEANPQFTVDGDGTVVVPSALWMSTDTAAEDYWVNLDKYDKDHPISSIEGRAPFNHGRIFEVEPLRNFITDILTDDAKPLSNYGYISSNTFPTDGIRLRYALHSPLNLNLYDGQGHHTGISTTSGQIEEQIPGTYYTEFGDIKSVITNTDIPLHIVMSGYATSTFTFRVDQLQGDVIIASTTWKDMPVTPNTKVSLDNPGDIGTLSPMKIDTNGDGTSDLTLAPVPNGVVIPPKYIFSGFLQPINDAGHQTGQDTSIFKAGSTIPVKFQLKSGAGVIVQASELPLWFTPAKGSSLTAAVNDAATSGTASSGSAYKWDSGQYIYNWSTKGLTAGYWYTIYAKLDDGTIYSVRVGLR